VDYKSLKNLWQVVASFGRGETGGRRDERRRESRLPAHGLALIHWEAAGEGRRTETVSLLGFSEHGCSFRTSQSLALDLKILVQATDEAFTAVEAVVRHSAPEGDEFIVGAEIVSRGGEALERNSPADTAMAEPGGHEL
jgi:hypothetical protein